MLADASSTTVVGSQACCATSTATSGTLNVDGQRGEAGSVVEILELGGQRLDLAAVSVSCAWTSRTSLILVAFAAIALEGRLAGAQVRDPRLEVDDLAGHLDGLGLFGDDLGRQAVEAAQGGRARLPLVGRDAVGDLGDGLVAVVARGRRSDVAAEPDDRVARDATARCRRR